MFEVAGIEVVMFVPIKVDAFVVPLVSLVVDTVKLEVFLLELFTNPVITVPVRVELVV